ncbi:lycopene beta cyclase [Leptolyngbya sp. AN02str]|uniref:lycopene beta cyclase n=1 Tax=Leptolyngbya sp. AN02str TaxID=3423363 RepID=UPI003D31B0B4
MVDALVIGSGPAGVIIAAALCDRGLCVHGLTPTDPNESWPNTYGIWVDELEPLGLTQLLSHRWKDCVMYAGPKRLELPREYGLLDKEKMRSHFLAQCQQGHMVWHRGKAANITQDATHTCVTTTDGTQLNAKIVIDTSGHFPALVQRDHKSDIAFQAAYGIVGRFSSPPIAPHQFVFMDFRSDHLTDSERQEPPTFLYAMDLGDGIFFVEETSLANYPAIPFDVLERRLHQRLAFYNIRVLEEHHVERCLFPMNVPMPTFEQPAVGFGGAASMVHPASGYMVGSLLRRAPGLADAIAQSLPSTDSPQELSRVAWRALWPSERLRKRDLYLFGLENLMQFEEAQIHQFFASFFHLSLTQWSGFLADTLSMPELIQAMILLFGKTTNDVRKEFLRSAWAERSLLWQALVAAK